MIVDFDNLNKKQEQILDRIKYEVISDFNDISSRLLDESEDIRWYINNATSRNTNYSNFLYYMQCVALLTEIELENSIDCIYTSDKWLYLILKEKYNVVKKRTFHFSIKTIKEKLYPFYQNLTWSFFAFINKSMKRVESIKMNRFVTILDVDIAQKTDRYYDRYYGNVLDRLPDKYSQKCYYMIIYLPIPHRNEIKMIEKNTSEVDTVSGATMSSKTIKAALRNALAKGSK